MATKDYYLAMASANRLAQGFGSGFSQGLNTMMSHKRAAENAKLWKAQTEANIESARLRNELSRLKLDSLQPRPIQGGAYGGYDYPQESAQVQFGRGAIAPLPTTTSRSATQESIQNTTGITPETAARTPLSEVRRFSPGTQALLQSQKSVTPLSKNISEFLYSYPGKDEIPLDRAIPDISGIIDPKITEDMTPEQRRNYQSFGPRVRRLWQERILPYIKTPTGEYLGDIDEAGTHPEIRRRVFHSLRPTLEAEGINLNEQQWMDLTSDTGTIENQIQQDIAGTGAESIAESAQEAAKGPWDFIVDTFGGQRFRPGVVKETAKRLENDKAFQELPRAEKALAWSQAADRLYGGEDIDEVSEKAFADQTVKALTDNKYKTEDSFNDKIIPVLRKGIENWSDRDKSELLEGAIRMPNGDISVYVGRTWVPIGKLVGGRMQYFDPELQDLQVERGVETAGPVEFLSNMPETTLGGYYKNIFKPMNEQSLLGALNSSQSTNSLFGPQLPPAPQMDTLGSERQRLFDNPKIFYDKENPNL